MRAEAMPEVTQAPGGTPAHHDTVLAELMVDLIYSAHRQATRARRHRHLALVADHAEPATYSAWFGHMPAVNELAAARKSRGDLAGAASLYRRALLILQRWAGRDHPLLDSYSTGYVELLDEMSRRPPEGADSVTTASAIFSS
jgi:hypothetical protein